MLKADLNFVEALPVAALGILIVLLALALLAIIFRIIASITARKKQAEPLSEKAAPAVPEDDSVTIPAGPRKLVYDCDDKTAAMLMAIVCDELGKSPDELWFKSIRQIKDNQGPTC